MEKLIIYKKSLKNEFSQIHEQKKTKNINITG